MFTLGISLIVNYLFVLAGIVLFVLPFYVFYRVKHPRKEDTHYSFSHEIELFFMSNQSNYLVFFWAMGEALFWFVIPEFLLLLVVFMRIHRKRQLLTYDVAGTVAGTIVAFGLNFSNNAISNIPFIQPKMVDQTLAWYDERGIFGLFYQPFSGVPYKVFTLTADRYDFFIVWFIILAVLVRMSRYVLFFGIFVGIYPALHKFVYKNYFKLFLASVFIFSVLLLKVVHKYN